ncbi:MBL fold metallo-hydrolase [Haloglomus halophilum]|uniref:MBL fold metallo-hydrolase n=1 Tax=Haloglomus halophilum TaxID=2962672 RepID=UPI0020C98AE7|nr:MBL fold metallo-hydrolase [Haloglomus halophilum]
MTGDSANVSSDTMTPEALRGRLDQGEPVGLLDVRAESEAEQWRIGGESVDYRNVPYFQMLEGIPAEVLEDLPGPEPVVVVCAKGDSSDFIAEQLREAGVDAVNLERGMRGWADLYDYTELAADTDATIAQYHRPSSGCLSYLVVDGDEALVVDPLLAFVDEYAQDVRTLGAELTCAMDTHVHADHVSALSELGEQGVRTCLPEASVDRGVAFDVDRELVDGDTLAVGDTTVEVVHTPGHTSGMTSLLVDDAVLLTGDGLFVDSVARPDLEHAAPRAADGRAAEPRDEGDEGAPDAAAQLYDTLQRLLEYPDDLLVAPGHASEHTPTREDGSYTATLGTVRERLPVLDADRETFIERVLADMPPRPANYEAIIDTNMGRGDVDRDQLLTMELGPNNCAASEGRLDGAAPRAADSRAAGARDGGDD